jgi:FAD/FMN-containing dehydrogenase
MKVESNSSDYTLPAQFIAQLKRIISDHQVSMDPDDLTNFGRDWTRYYSPKPSVVVFPESTLQVSAILKLCSENKVAVVPSGGRTGLAGGAMATRGEVVLSFDKMRSMGQVDGLAQTVRVHAGAITEAVHDYCKPFGLTWPVDFASKGSSSVGGNIATNAGGVKVLRYGLTRNWVLGLTVVLMNGEILELNGALEKNNTGIDLRQLFIGSEGILGVITEATLKLAVLPGESDVFFFGLTGLPKVFELFQAARSSGFLINAFECLSNDCLQAVLKHRGMASAFSGQHDQYVLMEIDRPLDQAARDRLEVWLTELLEQELVQDAVLAQSPKEATSIWSMREGVAEALAAQGLLHKHDVSLPIAHLQEFLKLWSADLSTQYPSLKPYIFGHVGDGNLHINLLKPESMPRDEFNVLCAQADENLFQWVQKFQGSVSAEHGIGLLKKHMLPYSRTPVELALMRDLKRTFDPAGLLNPGKVL